MFSGLLTERCVVPSCNYRIPKKANFCKECGAPRGNLFRLCFECGASVASDSRYCHRCNFDLQSQPFELTYGQKWRRLESQVAIKYPLRTTEEIINNGIEVGPGTKGYVYVDGQYDHELEPGYHVHTTLWERMRKKNLNKKNIYAILIVDQPFYLDFKMNGLHTCDHVPLDVEITVKIQLKDQHALINRHLLSQYEVSKPGLINLYESSLKARIQTVLNTVDAESCLQDSCRRRDVDMMMGNQLQQDFEQYGFDFIEVHTCNLKGEGLEHVRTAMGASVLSGMTRDLEKKQNEQAHQDTIDSITKEQEIDSIRTEYERNKARQEMEDDMEEATAWGDLARRNLDKIRKSKLDHQIAENTHIQSLKDQDADRTIRVAQGLHGVDPNAIVAAINDPDARRSIERLELIRHTDPRNLSAQLNWTPASQESQLLTRSTPVKEFGRTVCPTPINNLSLSQLADTYRPSIGLVGTQLKDGTPLPIGTAWLVAPNIVATNAHVAEGIDEDDDLATHVSSRSPLWVSFPNKTGTIAKVVSIKGFNIHPLWGKSGKGIPGYDIALIELNEPLNTNDHPLLPIADNESIINLEQAQPVHYMGYPMEGVSLGGVSSYKPAPIFHTGVISRLSNWNLEESVSEDKNLIGHSCPIAGGASGSPLFNNDGKVVGIVSAGSHHWIPDTTKDNQNPTQYRRISHAAQVNYAQRINLLGELL